MYLSGVHFKIFSIARTIRINKTKNAQLLVLTCIRYFIFIILLINKNTTYTKCYAKSLLLALLYYNKMCTIRYICFNNARGNADYSLYGHKYEIISNFYSQFSATTVNLGKLHTARALLFI